MAPAAYHRAATIDEALELLARYGDEAKLLAGGQSLIPMISLGLARPGALVDIGSIEGLDIIDVGTDVRIGPLVRHAALARPPAEVDRAVPLLAAAAPYIGHGAIRARGTFVGSVAHGDPAAEWPAVAVALDGRIDVRSPSGEREIPAAEFYLGPLTTDLADDEIVVGVRLPVAPPRTGADVQELAYRHGDYAIVGVAAQVSVDESAAVSDVRIGLFGVGGTPIRAVAAETAARSGPGAFADAGRAASEEADPVTDATASAAYRRRMVAVFVRRALERAHARAVSVAPGG